ncbi:aldose epimerase family protein [Aquabacterium sp. OR-4]|uniref:aldose epimerase family protein n=1 Tax=Aquabacterium sp. OR-4 TaxID=2978127 RepID=UPI0028C72F77|nr:aldose epimerase family protein [Aquabacterium sp. OR-4]MDT7836506.1 aldose epimerase family protein [Aquabacterium sp. OR-4]
MTATTISCRDAGTLPDGRAVAAYTLQRGALSLTAITLGGIVTRLEVPDRAGRVANVVLGFDALQDYATRNPHFGTLTGRLCNRVAGGRFMLDGQAVQLSCNDGPNSLHGGHQGFGQRLWQAEVETGAADVGAVLCLRYRSPAGEEGYPGALLAEVRYSLPDAHTWAVDYAATTDAATVVSLTQHAYFNLAGGGSALGHRLRIAASRYDAVDATLIPQQVCAVAGTPFDLRQGAIVADGLAAGAAAGDAQMALARGYDHHWHLDAPAAAGSPEPVAAAWLADPLSGRTMCLLTTAPGLQFYSGNFLDGSLPAPGGGRHARGNGLCLEPQHAPNAINRPDMLQPLLRPGQVWRSRTLYRFGTEPAAAPGVAAATGPQAA